MQPLLVIPEFREAEYPGPRVKGRPEPFALGTGSRAIALARHDIVSSSRVGVAGDRLTPFRNRRWGHGDTDAGGIALCRAMHYVWPMKTLTVRIPDALATEIEVESRKRGVSKSHVIRERLQRERISELPSHLADIADLIGSVDDDLPADLSARKKHYLRLCGYGRKRSARTRSP